MKASIKFRDEQKPLLRAKIPLNILNLPLQSGISVGESRELSLNLSTFFDSGPALKFSYRPNDLRNPYSFTFKMGIGHFGSPTKSPLTLSAAFNLIGSPNPSLSIHFKPDFGDVSLKKSHSSEFVKNLGAEKSNSGAVREENSVKNRYFKWGSFFPATVESAAEAGLVVNGLVKGAELSARTAIPLGNFALLNFRWGFRFPARDGAGGIVLPLLVMSKIKLEHVSQANSKEGKVGPGEKYDNVVEACLEVKKQLEVIRAENELLSKAFSDLRSDIAAGKMEFLLEQYQNKYSGGGADRRGNVDKKSLEGMGFGGEGNDGLKDIANLMKSTNQ